MDGWEREGEVVELLYEIKFKYQVHFFCRISSISSDSDASGIKIGRNMQGGCIIIVVPLRNCWYYIIFDV